MQKDHSKKWEYIAGKVTRETTEKPGNFSPTDQQDLDEAEKDFQTIRENADTIAFLLANKPNDVLSRLKRKSHSGKKLFLNNFLKYAAVIVISLLSGWFLQSILHSRKFQAEPVYATLFVPNGQMAQLELPDGTQVWLNSETTIKYPGSFNGDSRDVELIGEAFFNVKSNPAKPFNIKTTKSIVQVTGTSLNVDAYEGATEITTLIEGKVAILNQNKELLVSLQPGQSAFFDNNNELDVYKVDTRHFSLWKEGKLVVDNVSLADLSQMLERWYNVEITIPDEELKAKRISGTVLKYKPIDQILEILTLRENIDIEVVLMPDDRNIIKLKKSK
ncbi:FecR family protein [Gaoshiqia sp. Z1-71]|uniref:FecR family protein n=1 Tax=Gaoshiqia hydrogeniformans TaxID=3290090 RepID=UPI003BF89141